MQRGKGCSGSVVVTQPNRIPTFCCKAFHILTYQQAYFLVEEGSSPVQIDEVLKDFGMPMGRFEVRDLSGECFLPWLTKHKEKLEDCKLGNIPVSKIFC